MSNSNTSQVVTFDLPVNHDTQILSTVHIIYRRKVLSQLANYLVRFYKNISAPGSKKDQDQLRNWRISKLCAGGLS